MSVAVEGRVCTNCGEWKPGGCFRLTYRPSPTNKFRSHCRVCEVAIRKERHAADPDPQRWRTIRYIYGIDKEDYELMAEEQNWSCAICGATEETQPQHKYPASRRCWLNIDHDHETGDVRGLLCYRCNHGIGCLDTPDKCKAAAEYLAPWVVGAEGGGSPSQ